MIHKFRTQTIKKLRKMRRRWTKEFYREIADVAEHPAVLRMKKFPHHGSTNCYQHCMNVAYYNYQWCTHAKKTGDYFHGMTHPGRAYKNARRFFRLNPVERDVIVNHMWPVTLFSFPRTFEGWITTVTDKYCGACETSRRN